MIPGGENPIAVVDKGKEKDEGTSRSTTSELDEGVKKLAIGSGEGQGGDRAGLSA